MPTLTLTPFGVNNVTHACLFSFAEMPEGDLRLTVTVRYTNKTMSSYGPFAAFLRPGWVCIPLLRTNGVVSLTISAEQPLAAGVAVAQAVLLSAVAPPLTSGPAATHQRILEVVADRLFLKERPESSELVTQADAFLKAFPTDLEFFEKRKLRVHSAILRARTEIRGRKFPHLAKRFTYELSSRAMWFLYTGNLARLVGWFDRGTRSMGVGDALGEFDAAHLDEAFRDYPHRAALLMMGGALPFYLFAAYFQAPALTHACEEYLLARVAESAPELDVFEKLFLFAESEGLPFLAAQLVALACVTFDAPAQFEHVVPAKFFPQLLAAKLALKGADDPEKKILDNAFRALPGKYSAAGTDDALCPLGGAIHRDLALGSSWAAERDVAFLRPEIARPCPQGAHVPRFPADFCASEEVLLPRGVPALVVELRAQYGGDEPFRLLAQDVLPLSRDEVLLAEQMQLAGGSAAGQREFPAFR
eukprot:gnl/Chilomastix_cuspidata/1100.p1 GENE.gnl/Chilomastix_cuspidata/1100~~gnl/Chilomastix_cuspidata/1100.p1  ORF type:complete len:535 (+),score=239.03 gnl/Chilomastix_cuspidata/1100:183-1607(+)